MTETSGGFHCSRCGSTTSTTFYTRRGEAVGCEKCRPNDPLSVGVPAASFTLAAPNTAIIAAIDRLTAAVDELRKAVDVK